MGAVADSMVPAGVEDSHLCSSKQENCLKTVRSMSSPTKKVRFFVLIIFESLTAPTSVVLR